MNKKLLHKTISIFTAIALLAAVGLQFVSAKPMKEKSVGITLNEAPANIRALVEADNNIKQTTADIIMPSVSPFDIITQHPDGTFTAQVFGAPVRYEDEKGNWEFIDTSMKKAELFAKHAYENTANSFSVYYSDSASQGVRAGDIFTISVPDAPRGQLSPKSRIDADENKDGRIIYPNAFGDNTYLEYINTSRGFKDNIVLEQNIGVNQFNFKFQSDTHLPVLSEDGLSIQIVQKDNPEQVAYYVGTPYAYDSYTKSDKFSQQQAMLAKSDAIGASVEETTDSKVESTTAPYIASEPIGTTPPAAPAYKHYTEDCHYELSKQEDGSYTITVIVSEKFLNHPKTVYPVTIDPTYTNTLTPINVQDTYVSEASPSSNYGSTATLRIGCSGGNRLFTFIRFLRLPSAVSMGTITSANIRTNFVSGTSTGTQGSMAFITGLWRSDTLTWNTKSNGTAPSSTSAFASTHYQFDATNIVKAWYNSGYANHGVNVAYTNEYHSDTNSFVSSDSGTPSQMPKLTINYNAPASTNITTAYPANVSTVYTSNTFKWPLTAKFTSSCNFGCTNCAHASYHYGKDISGSICTPVMAMADGTIENVVEVALDNNSGLGCYVTIKHVISGTTYYTVYGHMSSLFLTTANIGKTIKKGQQIGLVGTTGNSTGPHLHFEIRINGNSQSNAVNPMNYFS